MLVPPSPVDHFKENKNRQIDPFNRQSMFLGSYEGWNLKCTAEAPVFSP